MNGDEHTPDGTRPGGTPRTDADLLAAARRGTSLLSEDPGHLDLIWDGIASAAFDDEDTAPDVAPVDPPRAVSGGNAGRRPRLVRSPERRQRRTFAGALVGIAAALLVVLGVSWAVTREPAPQPLATFRLDPLDERVEAGVAGSVVATEGGKAVEVDLAELPTAPAGTFYELWFLDEEAGRLVSLGPVGDDSTYVAPLAITPETWPTLDVSVEPADGDPSHSSNSILRGAVVQATITG